MEEMEKDDEEEKKIKIEIVTNNDENNVLRGIKMPKPILRTSSRFANVNLPPV